MSFNTAEDLFVEGQYFKIILPKEVASFPCLPTPGATRKLSSIPRNTLVLCQGVQSFCQEKAVIFLLKEWEDDKGALVYLGMDSAKRLCMPIHKQEQNKGR